MSLGVPSPGESFIELQEPPLPLLIRACLPLDWPGHFLSQQSSPACLLFGKLIQPWSERVQHPQRFGSCPAACNEPNELQWNRSIPARTSPIFIILIFGAVFPSVAAAWPWKGESELCVMGAAGAPGLCLTHNIRVGSAPKRGPGAFRVVFPGGRDGVGVSWGC